MSRQSRHHLQHAFRETTGGLLAALALAAIAIALAVSAPVLGSRPDDRRAPERLEPSEGVLRARIAEERRARERRREELETPAARERRRGTRRAFAGLGRDEAQAVARRHHRAIVAERAWPALSLDTGEQVVGLANDHTVRVRRDDGREEIVVASRPVAAAGDPQRLASLELQRRGEAFVPAAARVPLRIGGTLGEGVELTHGGVRIVPLGDAADRAGEAVGESVFYANTHADADTIVRPTASGVETFDQLRSDSSPERLEYRIDVPEGAQLREKAGRVAVEIVQENRVLAHILRPWAQDAEGRAVDVAFDVSGTTLILGVAHRGQDVAYPIVVDPDVVWDPNNTGPGSPLMAALWEWQTFGPGDLAPWAGNGYLGDGIYVRDLDGTNYGQRAEFIYRAPGDAIVQKLAVWDLRNDMSSWAYVCSHTGILSWVWGGWEAGPSHFCDDRHSVVYHEHISPDNGGSPSNMAAFGMVVPDSVPRAYVATKADPWVYLWDDNAPSVSWPTNPDWTSDVNRQIQARIHDGGLGVKTGQLSGPSGQLTSATANCAYDARCAQTMTLQRPLSSFGEGARTASASGRDLSRNDTPRSSTTTRLDTTSPHRLDLSGPLYERRATADAANGVFGGRHDLVMEGEDGIATDRRSGVHHFDVYVGLRLPDGSVPSETKYSTPAATCNINTYDCPRVHRDRCAFDTLNHPVGRYRIRAVAVDKVGKTRAAEFDVVVSPVTTDALKDRPTRLGLEQFWQYDETQTGAGSQAFVNLDTGNLVWHTMPIVNPGRGLASVVNLDYNSQAPRDVAGLDYNQVGQGFSLAVSTLTRLNEPLDLSREIGGVIELTDADGTRHRFTRNGDGVTYSPPPGVNLHFRAYSSTDAGRAWAITSPEGVTHFFGRHGYATSIVDRNSNAMNIWYETIGVDSISPPDDGGTCGLPRQLNGGDVRFVTGDVVECRRVSSITDAAGRGITITYYDPLPDLRLPGRVRRIIEHAGRATEFRYDTQGYLTQLVQALGTPVERSFQFEYEAFVDGDLDRDLLSVRDPNNIGNADGDAGETQFTYRPDPRAGLPAALKGKWTETLENRRRFTRSFEPGTATSTDPPGSVRTAAVTDNRGHRTHYALDGRGRVASRTDARGTVTRLGWDDDNNLTTLHEAFGSATDSALTTMVYNGNGLLTKRTDAESRVTELTYRNGAGVWQGPADEGGTFVSDLTAIKTPRAKTWSFGVDARGNVTSRTDPENGVAEAAYDGFGQALWEEDESNNRTTFNSYNGNGQPRALIDARNNRWVTCYDVVGNALWEADPRGSAGVPSDCSTEPTHHFTRYTYDALDRRLTERRPRLSGEVDDGQKWSSRSWEHDANDNLRRFVDAEARDHLLSYTPTDRQLTVQTPATVHAQPDNPRLEAAGAREVTSYTYDEEDNATKVVSPNGSATAEQDDFSTRMIYNTIGEQVAVVRQSRFPDPTPDKDLITSYAYDRRGNVVGMADPKHNSGQTPEAAVARVETESNRRYSYRYDKVNNLRFEVENPAQGTAADTWANRQTEHRSDAADNRVAAIEPRGFRDGNDPNLY